VQPALESEVALFVRENQSTLGDVYYVPKEADPAESDEME
jgi:hypothetical protein